jgi:hypothetical protein
MSCDLIKSGSTSLQVIFWEIPDASPAHIELAIKHGPESRAARQLHYFKLTRRQVHERLRSFCEAEDGWCKLVGESGDVMVEKTRRE